MTYNVSSGTLNPTIQYNTIQWRPFHYHIMSACSGSLWPSASWYGLDGWTKYCDHHVCMSVHL